MKEEKEEDSKNTNQDVHVGGENISDMTDPDCIFMREKLSGLFMSLFLTVPMLPKNAAMEIEPILASSLVLSPNSMDEDSHPNGELCFDVRPTVFGNFKETAKYLGRVNEWARGLICFDGLGDEDAKAERASAAEHVEGIR